MKTIIYVTYRYGGWYLSFKKEIELPFTPFYGLGLMFEKEHSFHITNDKYTTSTIYYDIIKNIHKLKKI